MVSYWSIVINVLMFTGALLTGLFILSLTLCFFEWTIGTVPASTKFAVGETLARCSLLLVVGYQVICNEVAHDILRRLFNIMVHYKYTHFPGGEYDYFQFILLYVKTASKGVLNFYKAVTNA